MPVTWGNRPCVDPDQLWTACREARLPTDLWWTKANSYRCPAGTTPGQGWVLMLRGDLNTLDLNSPQPLLFTDDTRRVPLARTWAVRATCVLPASRGQLDSTYLVELTDVRWLCARRPIDRAYNLRAYPGGPYLGLTLNAGSPWTWDAMGQDIWATVNLPDAPEYPRLLGAYPGLPFIPDGAPDGWSFYGMSAWDALGTVLGRLACVLRYNPITDAFSLARLGEPDALEAAAELRWDSWRTWDEELLEPASRLPQYVRVQFRWAPPPGGGTSPFYHLDVADTSPLPGESTGLYVLVPDDEPALGDGTTATNADDLARRAAERAADWFRVAKMSRLYRIYGAPLPDAGFVPGSQVQAVSWQDRGLESPLRTEVLRWPPDAPWQAPYTPLPLLTGGGGGQGGDTTTITGGGGAAGGPGSEGLPGGAGATGGSGAGTGGSWSFASFIYQNSTLNFVSNTWSITGDAWTLTDVSWTFDTTVGSQGLIVYESGVTVIFATGSILEFTGGSIDIAAVTAVTIKAGVSLTLLGLGVLVLDVALVEIGVNTSWSIDAGFSWTIGGPGTLILDPLALNVFAPTVNIGLASLWTFDATTTVYLDGSTINCGYWYWCWLYLDVPADGEWPDLPAQPVLRPRPPPGQPGIVRRLPKPGPPPGIKPGEPIPNFIKRLIPDAPGLIFKNLDPVAPPGEEIQTPSGQDYFVPGKGAVDLEYDFDLEVWDITGGTNTDMLQGKGVSVTAPTDGQVLGYTAATGLWGPVAPASGGTGSSGSTALTGSSVALSTSFAAAGVSVFLPAAGTYLLSADVAGTISSTNAGNLEIDAQLYDTTSTPMAISGTLAQVVAINQGTANVTYGGSAPITWAYTVTGAATVDIYARIASSTPGTTASIRGGSCTRLSFEQAGGGGGGSGVASLNSLTGALTLVAGTGITVTPTGSTITIATTGAGSGTVTSVATTGSLTGGTITGAGTLSLVNDSASPGDSQYYGTNSGGTKGFFALPAGGGTVTSVALAVPGVMLQTGGPITGAGTISLSFAAQPPNQVFAGPTSGGTGAVTFRSLVLADLPVLVASGASHAGGAVPDPGSTAGCARFLNETATWVSQVLGYLLVSTDQSTASVAPVNLSTADSLTITMPASGNVIVTFMSQTYNSVTGGQNFSEVFLDGTAQAASVTGNSIVQIGGIISQNLCYQLTGLAAGAHTIQVRHYTNTGGTADWLNRSLKVEISP